ncbi:MAG TPA: hypothetical protein VK809_09085 [Bacteroidia bacterium]|jgi:hypothetical protein|nr:hypothetical protein [Bacteroidia bacterium]
MQYIKDQISNALENQEELIKVFAAEPEKKLADRLHIIHLQSVICQSEKDEETAEFLSIMRSIIIEARLYKWDNNIADEVDETLVEIELAQEKHEHRKKLLEKLVKPKIPTEIIESKAEPKTDNTVQLGLF